MGTIINHSIIVSSWNSQQVEEAHKKAVEIFDKSFNSPIYDKGSKMIGDIMYHIVNSGASFFIAPDGSKEGWSDSDAADSARSEFLDWLLNSTTNYCDYVEVAFGGDLPIPHIVRDKDTDLENL